MKDRIKKDMFTAMKTKDVVTRDILRVLIGEIERKEQTSSGHINLTDEMIISLIKKMVETAETPKDRVVLEGYMPKQMSEAEICQLVVTHTAIKGLTSPRDMGKVMSYFKQNFDGTYDGKILSGIVKEILTKNK
jgi:uncharacterized protein YqeY